MYELSCEVWYYLCDVSCNRILPVLRLKRGYGVAPLRRGRGVNKKQFWWDPEPSGWVPSLPSES